MPDYFLSWGSWDNQILWLLSGRARIQTQIVWYDSLGIWSLHIQGLTLNLTLLKTWFCLQVMECSILYGWRHIRQNPETDVSNQNIYLIITVRNCHDKDGNKVHHLCIFSLLGKPMWEPRAHTKCCWLKMESK